MHLQTVRHTYELTTHLSLMPDTKSCQKAIDICTYISKTILDVTIASSIMEIYPRLEDDNYFFTKTFDAVCLERRAINNGRHENWKTKMLQLPHVFHSSPAYFDEAEKFTRSEINKSNVIIVLF